MAEQIIDVGTAPNNGTGDPLRTAFIKTDDNFDQIWAAGPVGTNVRIQNNVISTLQVNQDLALSPNGVGNVRLNNNTIPGANNTWFLGSTTNRWRGLFVGNVTAGNITTTSLNVPGDAYIGGNLTVVGNTIQIGNITTDTKTIQLANTATTDSAANGAGVTVGANDDIATFLYDSGNNVWTTNIGLQVDGAITGTSIAVSDATIYGNIDAINGNFTGNVTANYFFGNGSQLTGIETGATISNTAPALGNGGIWWNSVDGRAYVKYANAFIDLSPSLVPDPTTYVGNVSFEDITVTNVGNIIPAGNNAYSLGSETFQWKDLYVSNNTIYINSVPVTLGAGNVLTVNGNAVLSNDSNTSILTTGNITADYFIGNGSLLTGITATGNVTFDDNIIIGTGDQGGGNGLYLAPGIESPGNLQYFRVRGGDYVTHIHLDTGNNAFFDQYFGDDNKYVKLEATGAIVINSNDGIGNAAQWNFGTDGRLTFPGNPRIDTGANNFEVQAAESISLEANAVVNIYTDTSGTAYQWQFGDDGSLTAPGNISTTGNIDALYIYGDTTEANVFVGGTANILGNVTANYFIGDGSQLTGLPASYSDANVATFLAAYGSNTISTTGNVTAGNFIGAGSNVELIAQSEQWVFDTTGNLTLPSAGYLVVTTGIIGSGASPAPSLSGFSSIATTGSPGNISASGNLLVSGYANITGNINGSGATFSSNVTAQNFVGNISITGNVQGTSANVTLVAGAYSTVFDTIGTATLPGALQLAVYANATVRDTAIPSPTPGMMIYVTGTGMQVRGATGWNTIAGSGT